jgi:hypothetical protein
LRPNTEGTAAAEAWGDTSNARVVCWGFLRLFGENGINTEDKMRLQLFHHDFRTRVAQTGGWFRKRKETETDGNRAKKPKQKKAKKKKGQEADGDDDAYGARLVARRPFFPAKRVNQ